MRIFKAEQSDEYFNIVKGHVYVIDYTSKIVVDLTERFGAGHEPLNIRDPRLNSAADLIWPKVEIGYNSGDYYDFDRRNK